MELGREVMNGGRERGEVIEGRREESDGIYEYTAA